ncbi:hypothetical protein [Deinococcus gobiensis]|uniref:Uncharacterized protein n=1 Tax=Deinococcus gobiensis (strain DSM 21396 / JCM 16679 / CGMCC 1.7299 / I-0) TaxID=745776 RepID=H8GRU7_DEIGI|nr:hypothetical protein [Deinococcus gobiensis]AFD25144.1 hypothetical protein DGo_CA1217 [Deinococcus gobiensis I-0]
MPGRAELPDGEALQPTVRTLGHDISVLIRNGDASEAFAAYARANIFPVDRFTTGTFAALDGTAHTFVCPDKVVLRDGRRHHAEPLDGQKAHGDGLPGQPDLLPLIGGSAFRRAERLSLRLHAIPAPSQRSGAGSFPRHL